MRHGHTERFAPGFAPASGVACRAALGVALWFVLLFAAAGPSLSGPPDGATFDEYYRRFDAVEDAAGHVALAQWCRDHGLEKQAQLHVEAALRYDPNDARARSLAGFTEYRGEIPEYRHRRWLTGEELADAKKAEAALERERAAERERRSKDPFLAGVDAVLDRVHHDPYLSDKGLVACEDYPPYLLLVERGTPFHFEQIGTVLVAFHAWFRETFAEPFALPALQGPLVVIAWRDRAGYDAYCEHIEGSIPMRSRAAHYSLISREMVCHGWDSLRGNPYRPVIQNGIFTHEATHQLIHGYTVQQVGVDRAVSHVHWFQEGVAEFCGNLRLTPQSRKTGTSRYLFAQRAPQRAAEFSHARSAKRPTFSLDELLAIRDAGELQAVAKQKSEADWQSTVSLFYAEAWSFVYFLRTADDGKRWPSFLDIMKNELQGKSDAIATRKALGVEDLSAFEKEWLQWFDASF